MCLSVITLFTLSYQATAQTETLPGGENLEQQVTVSQTVDNFTPASEKQSWWNKIKNAFSDKVIYVVVGIIGGAFSKRGFIDKIKYWLGYYTEVSHELSELLQATSNGAAVINKALQSNGKLVPNSLEEIKEAGKPVIIEFKDFKAKLMPKK